jgi:hypothetical protein
MQENPENINSAKAETEPKNPVNVLILIDKLKELGAEDKEALEMLAAWQKFECESISGDEDKDPVRFASLQAGIMVKQIFILLDAGLLIKAEDVLNDAFECANNIPNNEVLMDSLRKLDAKVIELSKK